MTVRGVSTNECPVSALTRIGGHGPQSLELIQIISRARRVHKETGVVLLAPDMPCKLVDAIDVVAIESMKIEEVMMMEPADLARIEMED